MAEAGDGSTVADMGEEADGSTAGKRLYLRPALERVAGFSARLRKRSGNSNRVFNRQKSWPSNPGEPTCSFAVSVAFDYPHFAKK
jgi:hypothetical protein